MERDYRIQKTNLKKFEDRFLISNSPFIKNKGSVLLPLMKFTLPSQFKLRNQILITNCIRRVKVVQQAPSLPNKLKEG